MSRPQHFGSGAVILPIVLLLAGCAAPLGMAVLEAGASTGANAGISHTLAGITTKTFVAPAEDVHTALRRALRDMRIPLEADTCGGDTLTLSAHAADRDIDAEIEALTPGTTRLKVVASKDWVLKDSATATAIIVETDKALDALAAERKHSHRHL